MRVFLIRTVACDAMQLVKGTDDYKRRSRQEAAETRQQIIETAVTEFRNNGIDGTGLAGLMANRALASMERV
jgi:hypothetical protein